MDFRILGPLEVVENGRPLVLRGARERAVLAYLLLHAGEVVPAERLIDELWGEEPPDSARKSLQVRVAALRRALGGDVLVSEGRGYVVRLGPGELDLDRFAGLVREADGADPSVAAEKLREALALWRGLPLADFAYEPFAAGEIARLEELRLAALERRIEADLALGRHGELVPELEALVGEHPLRERLRGQLMLALYRSGRQADALEAYRQTRARLVAELGLEPSPALQQLERAILTHDAALEPPAPPRALRRRRRAGVLAAAGVVGALALAGLAVALARDGEVPAVTARPNSVAVIDPATNRVVADIPVGTHPVGIAHSGRAVWVANADDGTVSRIDPATRAAVQTIGVGAPATDVVVAADSVWTANGSQGTVASVSPQLGTVTRTVDLRGSDPLEPSPVYGIAAGAGALWVAGGRPEIARVHPRTGRITARIQIGAPAYAIAYGAGDVWVGTAREQLIRIDPRRGAITGRSALAGQPLAIAVGPAAVWAGFHPRVLVTGGDGLVGVNADTLSAVTVRGIPDPVALAVGRDAVWVASGAGGAVYRIAPGPARVVARIPVGGRPAGIALGRGRVWVSVDAPE